MSIEFVKPIDEDLSFTIDSKNAVEVDVTPTEDLQFGIESSISIEGTTDAVENLEFDVSQTGSNELYFVSDENKQIEGNVNVDTVYRGIGFTTDETLSLNNGVLSVNTAEDPEENNTLPITAAAVHTTVGNIEILLKLI